MRGLEHVFMRTLRHLYDTETQLLVSLSPFATSTLGAPLKSALADIALQSRQQASRLEQIFRVLYQDPRAEAAWVATALLREAWEAASDRRGGGSEACAAALLALKRYELTLYEALLRWSERCDFEEALPPLRRCIAEELLQASILSEFAFAGEEDRVDAKRVVPAIDHPALH